MTPGRLVERDWGGGSAFVFVSRGFVCLAVPPRGGDTRMRDRSSGGGVKSSK
jgi:hypothetical protein